MRTSHRMAVLLAAIALCCAAWVAPALGVTAEYYQQNTSGLDFSDANNGGWDNTDPDLFNRPYIKMLSVSNGGSTIPVVVNNGVSPSQTPTPQAGTDIYAFIAPMNACTVPPSGAQCYTTPNRFSVWIGHSNAGNWSRDLTGSIPAVDQNTTIDLTIGFHAAYSSIGWSWANGIPTWWTPAVTSGAGGDVRIKFTPKSMPSTNGMPNSCTTVPVTSCDFTPISAEVFQPQVLVSMDNTLGPLFAGSLFATTSSALGALDVPSGAGFATNPTMSYQLAGPHTTFGGATRSGGLYAVIPSAILSVFGTTPGAGFDQNLIPVQRTGDTGSGTAAWTGWTVGANGIDAELLSVTGITFSAPKFVVGRGSSGGGGSGGGNGGGSGSSSTGSGSGSGGNENRVKLGSTTSFAKLLSALNVRTAAGSKTSAKTSTSKVCTATKSGIKAIAVGTCRGTITVKPKTGKSTKKPFTLVVTKTGKRLPIALHR